jgi:sarcosine oxidase subunit gamma
MAVALHFGAPDCEEQALQSLALCDQSATPKLSVKGPGAEAWLEQQGLAVPEIVYAAQQLDHGSRLFRLGVDEFLVQGHLDDDLTDRLFQAQDTELQDVYCLQRQDATFLLAGPRAVQVLSQTCGLNLLEMPPEHLVFTRVAGVSCGVFLNPQQDRPTFQIGVDPSWGLALWESLVQIVEELEGTVVGLGCMYPQLQ